MSAVTLLGDFASNGSQHQAGCWRPQGRYVFNLEGPIVAESATPTFRKIALRTCPDFWMRYCAAGAPIAVSLANNHIADYGADGIASTLSRLSASGVGHFGLRSNGQSVQTPFCLSVGSLRVALLGYCDIETVSGIDEATATELGLCLLREEDIVRDALAARTAGADVVVACLHWGDEEVAEPSPSAVALAHRLTSSGITYVVGHHAHVLQGRSACWHHGIFYGLGNYLMGDLDSTSPVPYKKIQSPRNRRVGMVILGVDGARLAITTLRRRGGGPAVVAHPNPPKRCYGLVKPTTMRGLYRRSRFLGKLLAALWQCFLQRRVPRLRGGIGFVRYFLFKRSNKVG